MKTATKLFLTVLILPLATSALLASGQAGIYAVVSNVVFEPNDKRPERISKNAIRQESVAPNAPDSYPLNTGLTRLSKTGDLAAIVNQLRQALKR